MTNDIDTDESRAEEATDRMEPLFNGYVRKVDPGNVMTPQDNLSDLLADLMHWANNTGHNFEAALHLAQSHFDAEVVSDAAEDADNGEGDVTESSQL